jgi:hypothetical protein
MISPVKQISANPRFTSRSVRSCFGLLVLCGCGGSGPSFNTSGSFASKLTLMGGQIGSSTTFGSSGAITLSDSLGNTATLQNVLSAGVFQKGAPVTVVRAGSKLLEGDSDEMFYPPNSAPVPVPLNADGSLAQDVIVDPKGNFLTGVGEIGYLVFLPEGISYQISGSFLSLQNTTISISGRLNAGKNDSSGTGSIVFSGPSAATVSFMFDGYGHSAASYFSLSANGSSPAGIDGTSYGTDGTYAAGNITLAYTQGAPIDSVNVKQRKDRRLTVPGFSQR